MPTIAVLMLRHRWYPSSLGYQGGVDGCADCPVKVDQTTHTLLAYGAVALRMTQKDLLAEAVREYLAARREQINAALQEAMSILDGTATSRVHRLSAERLAEFGGVREP